ncbi:MAG: hypothetical protein KA419_04015 [Acidobacteria bacterium]|nr:hypothetical protein [Acidobacteriota bacterium]
MLLGSAACLPTAEPGVRFQRLGIENGLSQGTVHRIFQDSHGFLWIATDEGLNRFDGYSFVVYRVEVDNPRSIGGNCIFGLCEDRRGRLWAGVWGGGLSRLDRDTGRFTTVAADPRNPRSLSDNGVNALFPDAAGALWVGTETGLNRFDPDTGAVTRYSTRAGDPAGLTPGRVHTICQDHLGAIWAGTEGGLSRLNIPTGRVTRFTHSPGDPASLCPGKVRAVHEDRSGNLWVGTAGGLCRFDRASSTFVRVGTGAGPEGDLGRAAVNAILEDTSGTLWVGTTAGLYRWIRPGKPPELLRNVPGDPGSLSDNAILSLAEDRSGILWVGTENQGINSFKKERHKFVPFRYRGENPVDASTRCFGQTRSGMVLVGMHAGLKQFDGNEILASEALRREFAPFFAETPAGGAEPVISGLLEDHTGAFWIATYRRGLYRLDRDSRQGSWYRHDPADPHSLSSDEILTLYEDRAGNLWVGTDGRGLNRFDRQAGSFTRFRSDPRNPNALRSDFVMAIHDPGDGTIWVGTWGGGIEVFHPGTGTFHPLGSGASPPGALSGNVVTQIFEDSSRTLWIGTYGYGLHRYERGTKTFTAYTVREGLASNVIAGILEGADGELWISTYGGLSRFAPKTGKFINYVQADGLQSNEFNLRSCFKSGDGTLFFGGPGGINAFKPTALRQNTRVPPLAFTRFRRFGGEAPTLERAFLETGTIALSYRESFSVEFAALDFTNPGKNQYAYRLEGAVADWVPLGGRRELTFAGLSPGTYTLRVKGSNDDGVWNEEGITLRLHVVPPFWMAAWFRLVVGALLAAVLVVGYVVRVRRLKRRKAELEALVAGRTLQLAHSNAELENANLDLQNQILERERFERALEESNLKLQESVRKLQDMDQMKTELLNVVSHELRTPLTSVVGFAKVVRRKLEENLFPVIDRSDRKIDKTVGQVDGNMEIIVSEGERLTALINDFLDIAKMEAGKIEWNLVPLRFEDVSEQAAAAVRSLLETKQLRLEKRLPPDLPEVEGDRDRLVQVLINLLSNAFKFTPEGGLVSISAERAGTGEGALPHGVEPPAGPATDGEFVLISVTDTGPGILPENLDRVFEKFRQVNGTPPGAPKGTGLGLPICRQIVEGHGGRIWATSEPGRGSTFSFLLRAAAAAECRKA